jgi:hypothetical protein
MTRTAVVAWSHVCDRASSVARSHVRQVRTRRLREVIW